MLCIIFKIITWFYALKNYIYLIKGNKNSDSWVCFIVWSFLMLAFSFTKAFGKPIVKIANLKSSYLRRLFSPSSKDLFSLPNSREACGTGIKQVEGSCGLLFSYYSIIVKRVYSFCKYLLFLAKNNDCGLIQKIKKAARSNTNSL